MNVHVPPPTPDQQAQRQILGLSRLAQLEWEVRQAESIEALAFVAVNDTHRLVSYRHALVWLADDARIAAVSGGLRVEPTAPQIVWFGRLAAALSDNFRKTEARNLELGDIPPHLAGDRERWLDGAAVWLPLTGPGTTRPGALFLLREKPASEAELRLLGRVASAYGQAILAHQAAGRGGGRKRWRRRALWGGIGLVLALAAAVPVPLTVLADAKVVPAEPIIVAAPIEAVVKEIAVRPNEPVIAGQVLVRFDATELAAAREIAAKRVAVLAADSQRAEAQAFRDAKALAEIGLLRAKLGEGESELAWAEARLARAVVRADQAGVVLFDDPINWEGKPVKVGERIMVVADPRRVRLEIQLAPEDGIVARAGGDVDFFLATAPSEPVPARLLKVSYEPRQQPSQTVAFIAEAELVRQDDLPRLGLTGTAKLYGERVSIAYALLRKPLAAFRRMTGL